KNQEYENPFLSGFITQSSNYLYEIFSGEKLDPKIIGEIQVKLLKEIYGGLWKDAYNEILEYMKNNNLKFNRGAEAASCLWGVVYSIIDLDSDPALKSFKEHKDSAYNFSKQLGLDPPRNEREAVSILITNGILEEINGKREWDSFIDYEQPMPSDFVQVNQSDDIPNQANKTKGSENLAHNNETKDEFDEFSFRKAVKKGLTYPESFVDENSIRNSLISSGANTDEADIATKAISHVGKEGAINIILQKNHDNKNQSSVSISFSEIIPYFAEMSRTDVEERIKYLRSAYKDSISYHEMKFYKEQLAYTSGGVANIYVPLSYEGFKYASRLRAIISAVQEKLEEI
ncbi:MAG: hypothetical protein ACOCQD_04495, partial [archaeon]